ncbi:dihydrofolate reductase [Seleniivibrio woodruffii]|uniref:Dihydrofolate reductase n=1 Tax=Seleniivibrio woodruffii TaxID=1078050 RepID=A0A4R1KC91_9BACT|nr:dihydrofolate reductase [Seleniivibrio woodruffii]TCK60759.1 dihydrofolate reductase [Seleniivibrio woodruffii]TVZ36389.1 dihydrofolate reductase [Seleniivibrio woodruffii]
MKELYLIAAMTKDRVIGSDGKMPWHIPQDLKMFRKITTGNIVVMGRKTYESIGKPLPERENIVLSHTPVEGVTVCGSILEAVRIGELSDKKLFFIGGAEVYGQVINIVSHMLISWINGSHKGDSYFPEIDFSEWHEADKAYYDDFTMVHYTRRQSSSYSLI